MGSALGTQLQRAIQSGDFSLANALVPQYREHLHRDLTAADNLEVRLRVIEDARQLLEESLHLSRVMRAHIAAKLRATESLCTYQLQRNEGTRWSVTG